MALTGLVAKLAGTDCSFVWKTNTGMGSSVPGEGQGESCGILVGEGLEQRNPR